MKIIRVSIFQPTIDITREHHFLAISNRAFCVLFSMSYRNFTIFDYLSASFWSAKPETHRRRFIRTINNNNNNVRATSATVRAKKEQRQV